MYLTSAGITNEGSTVYVLERDICLTTSLAQRLALWALDEKVPGSIPGRINLDTFFFSKLVLVRNHRDYQMNSIALLLIV